MKNKRTTALMVILLTVVLLFDFPAASATSALAEAVDNPWMTISGPKLEGCGRVRSIAVADSQTVFLTCNSGIASQPGGPTSYILRTTDGGDSFTPVGNLDPASPQKPAELSGTSLASPTELILAISSNYAQDRTLFVAVAYSLGTTNQIYRSKDGGETFHLLGDVYFPNSEVVKTISVSSDYAEKTDYTLAVGTINPANGKAGNLYLYVMTDYGPSWQRVNLIEISTGIIGLDFYALRHLRDRQLVAIATPDSETDQSFYEYRLKLATYVGLPDSPPNRVKIGAEGVFPSQSVQELEQSFDMAFPSDWSADTQEDTILISYSSGGSSPAGNIYRRTGLTAGYRMVYTSTTEGYPMIVMRGDSVYGSAYAAGEVKAGSQAVVICSPYGHSQKGWSCSVPSGPAKAIDGLGGKTVIGLSKEGVLYVGTGGARGGLFKPPRLDALYIQWQDKAIYNDTYPYLVDWWVGGEKNIFLLMVTSNPREGALFKTNDDGTTWHRVRRFSLTTNLWGSKLYPSPNFITDSTIYLVVGGGRQIFKSENSGLSFLPITNPSQIQAITTLALVDAKTIWAQLSDNTIVLSFDGGTDWRTSDFSPSGQLVSIAVSPNYQEDKTLAGILKDRPVVFISRDGGISWRLFGAALPGSSSGDLTFSPDYKTSRMIYVTSKGASATDSEGGIYYLKDDGAVTPATNWIQKLSIASILTYRTIDGYRVYPDAGQLGKAVMEGKALYAPAGSVIVATYDITASLVEWHLLPLLPPAKTGENLLLEEVEGGFHVYTRGLANNICLLIDTPERLEVPQITVLLPIAQALSSIKGKYPVVFGWDAPKAEYLFYIPDTPDEVNTLKELEKGKGYWIMVTEATTLVYKAHRYSLAEGWNLIGWLGD